MKIPIYGRYCGPEHGVVDVTQPPTPIDLVDAACMRHDACYGHNAYFSCACDARLVRELDEAALDGVTQRLARMAIRTYFAKIAPLYCRTEGHDMARNMTVIEQDTQIDRRLNGVRLAIEMDGQLRSALPAEAAEILSLFTETADNSEGTLEAGQHVLRITGTRAGIIYGELISPEITLPPRKLRGLVTIMGYVVWLPAEGLATNKSATEG